MSYPKASQSNPYKARKNRKANLRAFVKPPLRKQANTLRSRLQTRTKLSPVVGGFRPRGGGLAPLAPNKRRAKKGGAPTSEPPGFRAKPPVKRYRPRGRRVY